MGKEGWARSVPRRRLEARPGGRYDLRVVSATGRSLADCRIRRISPGAGTHLSAAVSRALHRRLVALVVIDVSGGLIRGSRARATLGTFHGPSPPSPRFTATEATCCSPLATRIFARDPARANRPLDSRATTPRTRRPPRARLRFTSTRVPIRRASRDRGRASRARDAVPSRSPRRKPSESGYDATGRCRGNCSVKSEPGRRARETFRDVSRDFRLLESSATIQALMSGARRARVCAARAAAAMRRASSFRKSQAGLLPHLRRGRCCRIHNSYFRRGSRDDLTRERLVETSSAVERRTRGSFGAPRAMPSSRPTGGGNRQKC